MPKWGLEPSPASLKTQNSVHPALPLGVLKLTVITPKLYSGWTAVRKVEHQPLTSPSSALGKPHAGELGALAQGMLSIFRKPGSLSVT